VWILPGQCIARCIFTNSQDERRGLSKQGPIQERFCIGIHQLAQTEPGLLDTSLNPHQGVGGRKIGLRHGNSFRAAQPFQTGNMQRFPRIATGMGMHPWRE